MKPDAIEARFAVMQAEIESLRAQIKADMCPHVIDHRERDALAAKTRQHESRRLEAQLAVDEKIEPKAWVRITSKTKAPPDRHQMHSFGTRKPDSSNLVGAPTLDVPELGWIDTLATEVSRHLRSDWKFARAVKDGDLVVEDLSRDQAWQLEQRIRERSRGRI